MKLGIKIGLRNNWQHDVIQTRPDFVEVWFHAGQIEKYKQLLNFLQQQHTPIGLHFWGCLPDQTLANLAHPDKQILQYSRNLVKKTIDLASNYQVIYVNLHPGATKLAKIDFDQEKTEPLTKPADINICMATLTESLVDLAGYAKKRQTRLLVESVPKLCLGTPWHGRIGRLQPIDIGELQIKNLVKLLNIDNLYFTNDFGHTAGNIISSHRTTIKQFLFNTTEQLADKTKLLHVSYIIPPYNGTDYHGSLTYDEFETTSSLPNYQETQRLLKLFVDRDDVYALVEPETDHVGNFLALKQLVRLCF